MIIAVTGDVGGGKTHFAVNKIVYRAWRHGANIYTNTLLFFRDRKTRPAVNIKDDPQCFTWWERKKWKTKIFFYPVFNKIFHIASAKYDPQDFFFWHRNKELIKDALFSWLTRPYRRGRVMYYEDLSEIVGARHGVIFLDEGSCLFDARNWLYLPDEFSNALRQSRKDSLSLVTTTQDLGQIDKNYRRVMQLWFECRISRWLHIGENPVIIGRFIADVKSVRAYYGGKDDAQIPVIGHRFYWISILRRRRYDTYYKVGFHSLRIIKMINLRGCENLETTWAIVPKKMTYAAAIKDMADFHKANTKKQT